MERKAERDATERLSVFIGEWRIETSIPDAPTGWAVFEWMPGQRFLIQRWGFPGMPGVETGADEFGGVAIIGLAPGGQAYVHHYFSQRFTGTFVDDRRTIEARWEISHDGEPWEPDFDLTYTRAE